MRQECLWIIILLVLLNNIRNRFASVMTSVRGGTNSKDSYDVVHDVVEVDAAPR